MMIELVFWEDGSELAYTCVNHMRKEPENKQAS